MDVSWQLNKPEKRQQETQTIINVSLLKLFRPVILGFISTNKSALLFASSNAAPALVIIILIRLEIKGKKRSLVHVLITPILATHEYIESLKIVSWSGDQIHYIL